MNFQFKAENYERMASTVYHTLLLHGKLERSRNGQVLRLPGVTTLHVTKPWERVNFSTARDANPFFHLVEAIAMLGRVNSVPLMAFFSKQMAEYSDNGRTYNAFYGTRARVTWGDQLADIVEILTADPDSRQAVIQLWDPTDLSRQTKDKACNINMIFTVDQDTGNLCMTTFNRSNDAIWGIVTGANVVHLSMFQEYVAYALGRGIGDWIHVSNNLHVYVDNPKWQALLIEKKQPVADYLLLDYPETQAICTRADHASFLSGCTTVCRALEQYTLGNVTSYDKIKFDYATIVGSPFLNTTVVPAITAYVAHKNVKPEEALSMAKQIEAADWRKACVAWLERRYSK